MLICSFLERVGTRVLSNESAHLFLVEVIKVRASIHPQQRVPLLFSPLLPRVPVLLLRGSILLLLPLSLLFFGVQVGVAAVIGGGTLVSGCTTVTRFLPSMTIRFASPWRLCLGEVLEDLDLCICVRGHGGGAGRGCGRENRLGGIYNSVEG